MTISLDGTFQDKVKAVVKDNMSRNQLLNNYNLAITKVNTSTIKKIFSSDLLKYLNVLISRYTGTLARKTVSTFFNEEMDVILPEVTSEIIYKYGIFNEPLNRIALVYINKGDTVLDIGAHYGYFSLLFSRLVGNNGGVYSFEPTPTTFSLLEKNTIKKYNVITEQRGCGDKNEWRDIKTYGTEYCAWNSFANEDRIKKDLKKDVLWSKSSVEVITIDSYVKDRKIVPNFLKIDVENYEDKVIIGAIETIKKYYPKIILETGSEASLKASTMLLELGYNMYKPELFIKPSICLTQNRYKNLSKNEQEDYIKYFNYYNKDLFFLYE